MINTTLNTTLKTTHKTTLMKLIETFPNSRYWNWYRISENPNIINNPDKPWNWYYIQILPGISL